MKLRITAYMIAIPAILITLAVGYYFIGYLTSPVSAAPMTQTATTKPAKPLISPTTKCGLRVASTVVAIDPYKALTKDIQAVQQFGHAYPASVGKLVTNVHTCTK